MERTQKSLFLILSVGLLGLSACSFSKDANNKKTTQVIYESPEVRSAQEALAKGDMTAFEAYLETMPAEQINEYLREGGTLLEAAVRLSNVMAVELLIKKGALPLKPAKNSSETPVQLAEKINPSIYRYLVNTVNAKKASIVSLLKKRDFQTVLIEMKAYHVSADDLLTARASALDLLAQQESQISDSNREFFKTLLSEGASLKRSGMRVLELSIEDADLFRLAIESFAREALPLNASQRISLLERTSLSLFARQVESLNIYPSTTPIKLAELQKLYIQKIVRTNNSVFSVEEFKQVLARINQQSADTAFCGECVEIVLTEPALTPQRGEMVRLLVQNSGGAPAGLLKGLLGRLVPADFEQVVSILTPAERQAQADALEGNWSAEEYKAMSGLGMKMTSQQAGKRLRDLFAARFNGDRQASETLLGLSSEWRLARGLLSADEEARLFTDEVLYVYHTDLAEKDLAEVLALAIVSEPKGLWMATVDGEKVWMSPHHLVRYNSAKGSSARFESRHRDFLRNISLIIPDLKEGWFLKTSKWTISSHDLLWKDILKDRYLVGKLVPQMESAFIRGIWDQWTWESPGFSTSDLALLLKATDVRFGQDSKEYREKYLPLLLKAKPTVELSSLLQTILEGMTDALSRDELSFAKEFSEYIALLESSEEKDRHFGIFVKYILKQNPRLWKVWGGSKEAYLRFLNGDVSRDPLCEMVEKCQVQFAALTKERSAMVLRDFDAANLMVAGREQLRVEEELILSLLETDIATVKALLSLTATAEPGSRRARFYAENPWLSEVQFFERGRVTGEHCRRKLLPCERVLDNKNFSPRTAVPLGKVK